MSRDGSFQYRPACSTPGCDRTASFKLAASWSDGTSRELKSYGLVCEEHRDEELEGARQRWSKLRPTAEEVVGPVEVFRLEKGLRDFDLIRVSDPKRSE
jgi:hypothetical protein